MSDDIQLVKRAKKGDASAFEDLVYAYEKKIYNMGLRYTNNQQDALDISQEVFLRVYRFLPQFNENSSFSTWLYRIASNVCMDHLAKRKRMTVMSLEAHNDESDYEIEVADLRYNPESEFERTELREAIAKGLVTLSEQHRGILIMRDINGMSYDEIARCLGIEEGTVKSRIARARDKLRAYLCETGNFSAASRSKDTREGSTT